YIPYTAEIGVGTEFAYGGIGVVIHDKSIIGENCIIGQGITIGGRGIHGGPPIIGNNVFIGAGSRLIGDFKIGDFAQIGVNSVVIKEVPEYSVVAGIPARIIKRLDKYEN
ncbi:serine acetyltransferase, partial [Clostridium perfringens]